VKKSVYAARFEHAPQRPAWMLVRADSGSPVRVVEGSDWLLEFTVAYAPENTVKSYAGRLSKWWGWCVDSGIDPIFASHKDLVEFQSRLQEVPKGLSLTSEVRTLPSDPRRRSSRTVAQIMDTIKQFYSWAVLHKRVPEAMGQGLSNVKTPRVATTATAPRLSKSQVATLLGHDWHPRNRLLIELLYGAGLREGEALGLRIEDVHVNADIAQLFDCDLSGAHIHVVKRFHATGVTTKSRRPRVVYLAPRVVQAYTDWNAWMYENLGSPDMNVGDVRSGTGARV